MKLLYLSIFIAINLHAAQSNEFCKAEKRAQEYSDQLENVLQSLHVTMQGFRPALVNHQVVKGLDINPKMQEQINIAKENFETLKLNMPKFAKLMKLAIKDYKKIYFVKFNILKNYILNSINELNAITETLLNLDHTTWMFHFRYNTNLVNLPKFKYPEPKKPSNRLTLIKHLNDNFFSVDTTRNLDTVYEFILLLQEGKLLKNIDDQVVFKILSNVNFHIAQINKRMKITNKSIRQWLLEDPEESY